MLVLLRKLNQEIVVDSNVKIKVLSIRGNHVRLGIEAPREVKVDRGETLEQQDMQIVEVEMDPNDIASGE